MPIPSTYNKMQTNQGSSFDALPEDTYQVRITKLELKENQPVYQSTEVEDKFSFEFTIVEEGEFKGRKLWLDVRPIMSAGGQGLNASWLYKIFCAVNGLTSTDTETLIADDVNSLEGKELRVVVKQKANQKGDLKNKITDVMALKKGVVPVSQPAAEEADINVEDIPF